MNIIRERIVEIGRSYIGKLEYAFFKSSEQQGPWRYNCYGFYRLVLGEAGLYIPNWDYLSMWLNFPDEIDPKAGDAIFTKDENNRRHIGIFVPESCSGIHLSNKVGYVEERPLLSYFGRQGKLLRFKSIHHNEPIRRSPRLALPSEAVWIQT